VLKHNSMKTDRVGVQLYTFLTSVLKGGDWPSSRFDCFIIVERAPSTHWLGSSGGRRTGLVMAEKGHLGSTQGLNSGHPPRSQSLYLTSYVGSHISK